MKPKLSSTLALIVWLALMLLWIAFWLCVILYGEFNVG